MRRWARSLAPSLNAVAQDRRGVVALMVVAAAVGLTAMLWFVVAVGVMLTARQALQANTRAAALDAAYVWSPQGKGGALDEALAAARDWHVAHPVPLVVPGSIAATASARCVTQTSASLLPCASGPDNANNAILVTQTGTVDPSFIAALLGFGALTVYADATAALMDPAKPRLVLCPSQSSC